MTGLFLNIGKLSLDRDKRKIWTSIFFLLQLTPSLVPHFYLIITLWCRDLMRSHNPIPKFNVNPFPSVGGRVLESSLTFLTQESRFYSLYQGKDSFLCNISTRDCLYSQNKPHHAATGRGPWLDAYSAHGEAPLLSRDGESTTLNSLSSTTT